MTDFKELLEHPEAFLHDPDPITRRLAVSTLAPRIKEAAVAELVSSLVSSDDSAEVRAEAVEVLGRSLPDVYAFVMEATGDPEPRVVEAAATALGDLANPEAVPWLIEAATTHDDKLVKEAAVAALGAIGDERAIAPLIELIATGPPQVRRRAVVALSVFDGAGVEAALRTALADRNPMVREAAEMVVGRSVEDDPDWHPVEFRPPGQ